MSNTDFVHPELPEGKAFRILTLLPGQSNDPIRCSTKSFRLEDTPPYNALSYTWGTETDPVLIELNGQPFTVRNNLWVLLRHIREADNPVDLWCDMLCVDQQNLDERNSQVRQMVEIYKAAVQVWIWLGEEIENLDAAISLMNRFHHIVSKDQSETDKVEYLLHFAESDFRINGWAALTKLVEKPWWTRVWVVQEVVHSNDSIVICGKHRFSWPLLQSLGESREIWDRITWALLDRERTFHSGAFVHASDRLDFICAIRKAGLLDQSSLMPLLRGVRSSQSTDPRDRVFAMLSLLKQDIQLCDVDYHKSISQVFIEAAAGIWRLTGSLHFLSWSCDTITRNAPKPPKDLPTWVPSWVISGKRLLELQSPENAQFTRKSMDDVFAQIDQHEYNVRVLPKFKDLVLAGGLSRATTEELLDEADLATRTNDRPYRDAAHFHRDLAARAFYINTPGIGRGWATSFNTGGQPTKGKIGKKSLYSATGSSFPGASMNIHEGALHVLGFPLTVVQDVSPQGTGSFTFDGNLLLWARTVLNKGLGLPVYKPKRKTAANTEEDSDSDLDPHDMSEPALFSHPTFWRVILADQWQGVRLPRPDGSGKLEIPGVGTIPPSSIDELFKIRSNVGSFAHNLAYRYRTIFTSRSSIGLAPPNASPGDIVFAIFGCDVPYLIRKTPKGCYLLGECYVHASMDGEALKRCYIRPEMVKLI